MTSQNRRPLYAKIAIARKQLPHFDEDTYRAFIENNFGCRSAADLSWRQLTHLVNMLAEMGAKYVAVGGLQKSRPHARSDYYEIADDQFGPAKRRICAIWKKLGYDMTALDTRCKREFNVPSFAWLRDWKKINRLVLDLERRERARDAETAASGQ